VPYNNILYYYTLCLRALLVLLCKTYSLPGVLQYSWILQTLLFRTKRFRILWDTHPSNWCFYSSNAQNSNKLINYFVVINYHNTMRNALISVMLMYNILAYTVHKILLNYKLIKDTSTYHYANTIIQCVKYR